MSRKPLRRWHDLAMGYGIYGIVEEAAQRDLTDEECDAMWAAWESFAATVCASVGHYAQGVDENGDRCACCNAALPAWTPDSPECRCPDYNARWRRALRWLRRLA